MNDLLLWISRNGGAAFLIGVFLIIALKIAVDLLTNLFTFGQKCLCSFTGKYPPPGLPRPIVQCDGDCNRPCKCCEEDECQVGCGCSSSVDE